MKSPPGINAKRIFFSLLAIITYMFLLPYYTNADIIFIGNPSITTKSLTRDDIFEIFTGKKIKWDDNKEIKFVIMKNAAFHKEFTRKYAKRSTTQFDRYWRMMLFSGEGSMLKNFSTVKKMIKYVSTHEGTIGYLSSKTDVKKENVIVIEVTD